MHRICESLGCGHGLDHSGESHLLLTPAYEGLESSIREGRVTDCTGVLLRVAGTCSHTLILSCYVACACMSGSRVGHPCEMPRCVMNAFRVVLHVVPRSRLLLLLLLAHPLMMTQGNTQEELPEVALAGVRINHLDLLTAKSLNPSSGAPKTGHEDRTPEASNRPNRRS